MAQITTVLAYDIEDSNVRTTVVLNGKNKSWTSNGGNLFKTQNGRYKEVGAIELYNSATNQRVAQFRSFAHRQGLVGNGLNDELGNALIWNVQDVVQSDGGGGAIGCFTPETEVLLGDGTQKPISEIQQGDSLFTANLKKEIVHNEVAHVFQSRHESLIALELSNKDVLKMSDDQPILSVSGPVTASSIFDNANVLSYSVKNTLNSSLKVAGRKYIELAAVAILYSIDTRDDGYFFVGGSGLGVKCKGYGGPYGPPPRYLPK